MPARRSAASASSIHFPEAAPSPATQPLPQPSDLGRMAGVELIKAQRPVYLSFLAQYSSTSVAGDSTLLTQRASALILSIVSSPEITLPNTA